MYVTQTYTGFNNPALVKLYIHYIVIVPHGENLPEDQNYILHTHSKPETLIVKVVNGVMSSQRHMVSTTTKFLSKYYKKCESLDEFSQSL